MIEKPTVNRLDWVPDGDSEKIQEPSGSKKLQGYVPGEPLPAQNFNWILYSQDQWAKYFEAITDELLARVLPTGTMLDYSGTASPSNSRFLLCDGKTIGSVSSGATSRANDDTWPLFELLWNSHANTELPIQDSTGSPDVRGMNAEADFLDNKRLPLPDFRGRVAAGKDDMGGSAANRLTDAGSGIDGTVMGKSGGTQDHTLTTAQMPAHTHSVSLSGTSGNESVGHTHTFSGNTGTVSADHAHQAAPARADNFSCTPGTGRHPDHVGGFDPGGARLFTMGITANHTHGFSGTTSGVSANHTHSVSLSGNTGSQGSGDPHPNVQPTWICTKIIKL